VDQPEQPEVSVIVPARNEQACLADCLRSLTDQAGPNYEILVIDDHSTDDTRNIAESFKVRVISADPLPPGWSGKCNAAWTGAKAAKGKWLLFTDADTKHAANSIASGLDEAKSHEAGLLSYSPRQEVHSFAERALMPVIFAELAATYRPKEVCDPKSSAAAANGQYLLIRRSVYDAVGGHAAVSKAILEDVELAKRVKQSGERLQFRVSDVVSTRMYRTFSQMWEGWTKNLALLFSHPRRLALQRLSEFALTVGGMILVIWRLTTGKKIEAAIGAAVVILLAAFLLRRIRRAHFDWLSNSLAVFGLPLFALLLFNSGISHNRGRVKWKGREYDPGAERTSCAAATDSGRNPDGTYN
jgi:glycosyltransferase involved in cell wall biosynthesis